MATKETEVDIPAVGAYKRLMGGLGRVQGLGLPLQELSLPIVILIVSLYFSQRSYVFLSGSNFDNITKQSAALAILVFGQTLVVISRGLDLSVGSTLGLAGILGAMAWQGHGAPLGMLTFLGTGLAVGLANASLIALFRLSPLIVTLGMLSVERALALIITNGLPISPMPENFKILGTESIGGFPIAGLFVATVFIGTYVLLRWTPFGVHIYAVGGNPRAARLAGINVTQVIFMVYVLNGLLAGLAGAILSSRVNTGQPLLGQGMELQVFAAVFLGGVALSGGSGGLVGVLFGVILIAILGNGLNLTNVVSFYQQLIIGWVLILSITLNRLLRGPVAED
jgi:ribose transport system permease protein